MSDKTRELVIPQRRRVERKCQNLVLQGNTDIVHQVSADPHMHFVTSVGEDASIRTWDLRDENEAFTWRNTATSVRSVMVNEEETKIFCGN